MYVCMCIYTYSTMTHLAPSGALLRTTAFVNLPRALHVLHESPLPCSNI